MWVIHQPDWSISIVYFGHENTFIFPSRYFQNNFVSLRTLQIALLFWKKLNNLDMT